MLFYTFTQLSQGENNKLTLAICIYTQTPRPFSKKSPLLIVVFERNCDVVNIVFALSTGSPQPVHTSLSVGAGEPSVCKSHTAVSPMLLIPQESSCERAAPSNNFDLEL